MKLQGCQTDGKRKLGLGASFRGQTAEIAVWQLSLSFPALLCYCESAACVCVCKCIVCVGVCVCIIVGDFKVKQQQQGHNAQSTAAKRGEQSRAEHKQSRAGTPTVNGTRHDERRQLAASRRRQDNANAILVESFAIYFYCSSLNLSVEATESHRNRTPDKSVRPSSMQIARHFIIKLSQTNF